MGKELGNDVRMQVVNELGMQVLRMEMEMEVGK